MKEEHDAGYARAYEKYVKPHDGSCMMYIDLEDNTEFTAELETGDIFRNLPHLKVNNH